MAGGLFSAAYALGILIGPSVGGASYDLILDGSHSKEV